MRSALTVVLMALLVGSMAPASRAQDGVTASDLEMLCVSEDALGIKGCVSYIVGAVSVMRTMCQLQAKGKVDTKGFLALDIPEQDDGFGVVDAFLDSMDVSEFRHKWGGKLSRTRAFLCRQRTVAVRSEMMP